MPQHTVEQGEHISSIALQYGFRKWETVWDDPDNSDLKQNRDPNVLFPGDVLTIPELAEKTEDCATAETHVFQVPAMHLKLRMVVRDLKGRPLPNLDCQLEVDGQSYPLTTDGNGMIEQDIGAKAKGGTLKIDDLQLELPVKIGHLDPVDEQSGLVGRLQNLGYYRASGDDVDEDELQSAVEEFQCDFGLTVDGIVGDQTKSKLKEIHGC